MNTITPNDRFDGLSRSLLPNLNQDDQIPLLLSGFVVGKTQATTKTPNPRSYTVSVDGYTGTFDIAWGVVRTGSLWASSACS